MSYYYDIIYRQVIRRLGSISTRPYNEKDENICQFSCALIVRESGKGNIDYQLVLEGDILCATNQIVQKTNTITISVDTNKLQTSYYLLEQADMLTYQLCNSELYNYGEEKL